MRGHILLTMLMATGCAGAVDAPSLAPRAVERAPIGAPGEPIEVATEADPALTARLAQVAAVAGQGDKAFQAERRAAEIVVVRAAGAAAGSDRWLTAQQALTALETALAAVREAAAAIDALRAEPANAAPGNRAAIDAAAARVDALGEAQQGAVAGLAARLL